MTSDADQPTTDSPEVGEESAPPARSRRRGREKVRTHFIPDQRPRWETWALVVIPLIVCFLGGGRSVFAKGVAATATGALILAAPPGYRLSKLTLLCLVALLVAPLVSFLPATWLGPLAEWRTILSDEWGIGLASTATPQPWVTFESWLLLLTGVVWLAWCASRGSTLDDRRSVIQMLVIGASVIAVLTLLDKRHLIHVLWWKFPSELGETYGPFANRNHTSSLMAMASVLCAAAAYDGHRNKARSWLFFLVLMVPIFIVILTNTSRAGLVLFFVGVSIWLWTAAMRKGFFKKVALIGSLALCGIAVVLVLGGSLSGRFSGRDATKSHTTELGVGRMELYSEVVKMTSAAPWTGVGLGNFVDVFPQVATVHEPRLRFLHPESDFFWSMAEGGMLTVIPVIAVVLLFASMTGPWIASRSDESASRQDRRLRLAAAIAAWMAVMHGIVDVPNHGLGYSLMTAMLAGLAIRPSRARVSATWADRLAFRLLGVVVLITGLLLLAVFFGRPALPGRSSAKLLAQQARTLSTANRDSEAMKLVNRAIELNPLDWTNYFLRATLHINLKHPDQQALLDFGRARAIEPHYSFMCIEEGHEWLAKHSPFAISAWKEFLRRNPERPDYFNYLLGLIRDDPALMREARKLAATAQLKLTYLEQTYDRASFDAQIDDMLAMPKSLEAMDSEGRKRFFRLWQERGNKAALKAALEKNQAWQQDGWQVLSEELAREGNFEGAYRLTIHYEQPPIVPSNSDLNDFAQLQHNFDMNPLDPRRGLDLYFAQKTKRQWDNALATLEKIYRLPDAPVYVRYEMAAIHAQKQDFRGAWQIMAEYLAKRK